MTATMTDTLSVREAAVQRRSIRAYEPGPIPREELEEILDVARRAPSDCYDPISVGLSAKMLERARDRESRGG